MAKSLTHAELRTVADVAELNTAEAAELFGELQTTSVPLGDRTRLQKVAWVGWVHSTTLDLQQRGGSGEQSAINRVSI
jgi:hypothetical protein